MYYNYFHHNCAQKKGYGQPFTIALNLDFHKDLLYGALKQNIPIVIEGGISYLHPHDRFFIKSIGRLIARSDTQIIPFKITAVSVEENKQAFYLVNDEKNIIVILHVDNKKDKPIMTYSCYNQTGDNVGR